MQRATAKSFPEAFFSALIPLTTKPSTISGIKKPINFCKKPLISVKSTATLFGVYRPIKTPSIIANIIFMSSVFFLKAFIIKCVPFRV